MNDFLKNLLADLRIIKNRVRLFWLKVFTDRVRQVEIKDKEGKTHRVTAVREEEEVCQHKEIRQIYGTFWVCMKKGCFTYFEITYKVMLHEADLLGFLDAMSTHLRGEPMNYDDGEPEGDAPPADESAKS